MGGTNERFPFGGTDYLVQIEDLPGQGILDVRVYVGGRVVFNKRHAYLGSPQEGAAPRVKEDVQAEIEKLLSLVKAAIQRGRITA
jgi:hypothetical protein